MTALLGGAAERGRPARLDRRHDTTLDAAEIRRMVTTERFAVAAEDVRHL
jgi:hypothetical protein